MSPLGRVEIKNSARRECLDQVIVFGARPSRIAALPDVPTMAEAGFPGVEVGSGVGLVAPVGTPSDIIDTLHRATAAVIATPGFKERMAAIAPQEYAKIIR